MPEKKQKHPSGEGRGRAPEMIGLSLVSPERPADSAPGSGARKSRSVRMGAKRRGGPRGKSRLRGG